MCKKQSKARSKDASKTVEVSAIQRPRHGDIHHIALFESPRKRRAHLESRIKRIWSSRHFVMIGKKRASQINGQPVPASTWGNGREKKGSSSSGSGSFDEVLRIVGLLHSISIRPLLHTLGVVVISAVTATPCGLAKSRSARTQCKSIEKATGSEHDLKRAAKLAWGSRQNAQRRRQ